MTREELPTDLEAIGESSLSFLRLFPLPDAVLLPGATMPLHIFEPRYRRMVADAMAADKVLAIAKLDGEHPGGPNPAVESVVGVGYIVGHHLFDDGRSLIAVRGILRARLLEEFDLELPYRVARGELLKERVRSTIELEASLTLCTHVLERLHRVSSHETIKQLLDLIKQRSSPINQLVDLLGAAVHADARQRQALLEELDPLVRLDYLCEQLVQLASRLEHPSEPKN